MLTHSSNHECTSLTWHDACATHMHSGLYAMAHCLCLSVCLSVCLSHAGIVSKQLNGSSWFCHVSYALRLSYTFFSRGLWVSPKIRELRSGTLTRTELSWFFCFFHNDTTVTDVVGLVWLLQAHQRLFSTCWPWCRASLRSAYCSVLKCL